MQTKPLNLHTLSVKRKTGLGVRKGGRFECRSTQCIPAAKFASDRGGCNEQFESTCFRSEIAFYFLALFRANRVSTNA